MPEDFSIALNKFKMILTDPVKFQNFLKTNKKELIYWVWSKIFYLIHRESWLLPSLLSIHSSLMVTSPSSWLSLVWFRCSDSSSSLSRSKIHKPFQDSPLTPLSVMESASLPDSAQCWNMKGMTHLMPVNSLVIFHMMLVETLSTELESSLPLLFQEVSHMSLIFTP